MDIQSLKLKLTLLVPALTAGVHFYRIQASELILECSMHVWDEVQIQKLADKNGNQQIAIEKTPELTTAHIGFDQYDAVLRVKNDQFEIIGYQENLEPKVISLPTGSAQNEILEHFTKETQKRSS